MGSLYFGYKDGSSYKVDGAAMCTRLPDISLETLGEIATDIRRPMSVDVECNLEANINAKLLNRLFGVDLANGRDGYIAVMFKSPHKEQIRRHKKRRINKKWAKRYGYRTKFVETILDHVEIQNERGCGVDVVGKTMDSIVQ